MRYVMLDRVHAFCIKLLVGTSLRMLMQLIFLYLGANQLVGSGPESWSTLIRVSRCVRPCDC